MLYNLNKIFLVPGVDPTTMVQNANGSTSQQSLNGLCMPKISRQGSLNRRNEHCDTYPSGVQIELRCILKEIRVITDKIRAEV